MRHLALATMLLAAPVHAQQWFSLSGRDSAPSATVVEVDLESLHRHEAGANAVVRVTHELLHAHPAGFGYRSFVATATIDCGKREIALESAAYYALPAGQGVRVGADSTGRVGATPMVAERIPAHARQALFRAACAAL